MAVPPTRPRPVAALAALALALVLAACASAPPPDAALRLQDGPERVQLRGAFVGEGADFVGVAAPFGPLVGVFDQATFSAVWTFRDGSTLANGTVLFEPGGATGVVPYTQVLVFTGGTGRFAGATGQATVRGTIDLATFAYTGLLRGELLLADGD